MGKICRYFLLKIRAFQLNWLLEKSSYYYRFHCDTSFPGMPILANLSIFSKNYSWLFFLLYNSFNFHTWRKKTIISSILWTRGDFVYRVNNSVPQSYLLKKDSRKKSSDDVRESHFNFEKCLEGSFQVPLLPLTCYKKPFNSNQFTTTASIPSLTFPRFLLNFR